MNPLERLERVDEWRWRIPRDEASGMRTHVMIYASERIMEQVVKDRSLHQAAQVAMLQGIVGPSLAMPDIHQGYGFPIGGVAAMDVEYGVVSPGGVFPRSPAAIATASPRARPARPRLLTAVDR